MRAISHVRTRGRRWMAIRAMVLAEEPFCRLHRAKGEFRPSVEVDHIHKVEDGGSDARSNLRGLCLECHKTRHGARPTTGIDGWPVPGPGGH